MGISLWLYEWYSYIEYSQFMILLTCTYTAIVLSRLAKNFSSLHILHVACILYNNNINQKVDILLMYDFTRRLVYIGIQV